MLLILGEPDLKFKYLLIILGFVIAIVLIAVLIPVLFSGSGEVWRQLAVNFRYLTLPLLAFMALLLIFMSVYFILNYRLLSLLEKEDWPALAYYLEHQIYVNGRYSNRNVRLLASSYLVISDFKSVIKLETKTHLAKPSLVSQNALVFGAARILDGNHEEAVSFFRHNLEKCTKSDKEWVHWFCGFSHLLAGYYSSAEEDFLCMTVSSKNVIISGLCSYFLGSSLEKKSLSPDKCRQVYENGKKSIKSKLKNAGGWKKEVDKAGNEIHMAIIRKYIDEAGKWIFAL